MLVSMERYSCRWPAAWAAKHLKAIPQKTFWNNIYFLMVYHKPLEQMKAWSLHEKNLEIFEET